MTSKSLNVSQNLKFAAEHIQSGNFQQAEHLCRQILTIYPNNEGANHLLGIIACQVGQIDKGIELISKAIKIKPNNAGAYFSLGNAFIAQDRSEEAIASYRKALSINPDSVATLNNLGNTFKELGRLDEAITIYRKILSIKPNYVATLNNLGCALRELCHLDEAVASYRKVLSINPGDAETHSSLLYTLNYMPTVSQEEIYNESVKWAQQHTKGPLKKNPTYLNTFEKNRRLRIGYVSPDFRYHSVNWFFEPFLKAHNSEHFEIFCYSNVKKPDDTTRRLQEEADHWQTIVGRNDKKVAEEIRRDRIDILVDLAGHTGNGSLVVFGYKPAPIQVSWLGYPNTTGLKEIDYRFVDELTNPVEKADDLYSEELIRLPNGFFCFQPTPDSPAVGDLPMKKTGWITFGSVNTLAKLNKQVTDLWSLILQKIPNSHLLVFGNAFADETGRNNFLKLFTAKGIEAERIEMIPPVNQAEFLAIHKRIDIILDPFPYNGQTSTCHSLWMGVPPITLQGEYFVARVCASILTRIGLTDFITRSHEEYLNKAIELAANPNYLSTIRIGMRDRLLNSSLWDATAFAKNVEEAYMEMWEKYIL